MEDEDPDQEGDGSSEANGPAATTAWAAWAVVLVASVLGSMTLVLRGR